MEGPIWLSWPFAGLMVISGLYHAGRLVTARQREPANGHDIDLAHLVMCAAMAAMLVMSFGAHLATVWAVVVGVPTLWFILRTLRALVSGGARAMMQPLQQLLMCAAMLFMLVVVGRSASAPTRMATGGMDMPGMAMDGQASHVMVRSTSSVIVTSFVFVGILGLFAARHARQLGAVAAPHVAWPLHSRLDLRQQAGGLLLAPGISLAGQLAMSGTMIYMLVLMA